MNIRISIRCVSILCLGLGAPAQGAASPYSVTTTATYHNIGIEVQFQKDAGLPDADGINVYVKGPNDVDLRLSHPLSPIQEDLYAGSILNVDSDTVYEIKLESSAFGRNGVVTSTRTRSEAFPAPVGAVYHVSSRGHDRHAGDKKETAFKTVGKALTLAAPGTTIFLHDGVYNEGDLEIPRSGTAGDPILITSAPGAKAVLEGLDYGFSPEWVKYQEGIYRTPFDGEVVYAFIDGIHLFNYTDLDALEQNRWGELPGFHCDGSYLYVKTPRGDSIDDHRITVPKFTNALVLEGKNHVQIKGIEFRYYGSGKSVQAVLLNGSSNNLIDGCRFHHVHVGVGIKGSANFNTIQNCSFRESPKSTMQWHAVKIGGFTRFESGYEIGGVVVYTTPESSSGNVIRYNTFQDMFDGAKLCNGVKTQPTKDLDFHGNHVFQCGDDGIETDGAARNVRIYDNVFNDYLMGISVAPCDGGPTYVFRNLIYTLRSRTWQKNSKFTENPFKFNVNSNMTTNWLYLYHNTCFINIPERDSFRFASKQTAHKIIARNNIFAGTGHAFSFRCDEVPLDFDYDDFFTSSTSYFADWGWRNGISREEFLEKSRLEPNGIFVDPEFVDAAGADFRLKPGSKLIDRGVRIPGVNDEYAGNGPDIGALEYGKK